ncbi:MAG: sulfotransferase [Candidatus Paceibacterota bacterium]
MISVKDKKISPIIITGSVRSGTSVMSESLMKKGAGFDGYTEGCFIDMMGLFLKVFDKRYKDRGTQMKFVNIMLKDVPKDSFQESFIEWFLSEYKKYSKYEGVWIDKTPAIEVLYSIPLLYKFLPDAKFIIMKRRSIENINSRLKKFKGISFNVHCELWAEIMNKISDIKKNVPNDRYIIVDQYDISTKPEEVAEKVGLFLNLNFDQIKKIANVFKNSRPEHTGGDESKIRSLEETNWTDEQKKYFIDKCAPVNDEFGWSLDENYYKG